MTIAARCATNGRKFRSRARRPTACRAPPRCCRSSPRPRPLPVLPLPRPICTTAHTDPPKENPMRLNPLIAGAALAFAALAAHAQDVKVGAITISHAYARATVPGQPAGGAFLTIANAGADDKLIAASTE